MIRSSRETAVRYHEQRMEEQSPQPVAVPQPPRVSVLIVLRPGTPGIETLLQELTAAPERDSLEIAVLDNGSGLVTGALEDEFPSVTFRRLPRNFGYAKAVNILAKNALGEYLFFLDPSLEVKSDTLTCLLQTLADRADAGGASPLIVDDHGHAVPSAYRLPDAAGLASAWKAGGVLPVETPSGSEPSAVEGFSIAAILVRKELVRGMNYFDERYGEFGPLLELCFQMRQAGKKLLVTPACTVVRRAAMGNELDSPAARAQMAADFALGASRFLARRAGFAAGLGFRLKAALGSFGKAVTFQSPGYHARQAWLIASGQKIDGTQSSL